MCIRDSLHALRIEDAGGQAQQRMHVRLLEQFAPDGFARAAFEEHVIRQHHRRATVLLENGEDVLEEIELFVAGGGPEIVAIDDERFLGRFACLVDEDVYKRQGPVPAPVLWPWS